MFRRWLLTASLLPVGCGLWPTADVDCLESGRCMAEGGTGPHEPVLVIGQPDANTNLQLRLGFNLPTGILRQSGRLFVADSGNHRVLIWNQVPTANRPADIVLGQPDLTTNYPNLPAISASTLHRPRSLASDGTRLFVADSGNRRVLIWNQLPTRNAQPADVVLGQPDFTSSAAGLSASAFGDNPDVSFNSDLFVTDRGNHRVLLWKSGGVANFEPAFVVFGQTNLTSGMANHGSATPSATSLSSPSGQVALTSNQLLIADSGNHRLLAYDRANLSNGAPALTVLGQNSATSGQPNGGVMTISASTLVNPTTVAGFPGGRVVAVDTGHNRVLGWGGGFANGAAADLLFGQTDFTGGSPNAGGVSGRSLSAPEGLALYPTTQEAYVADSGNHRVLYIPDITVNNRRPAATLAFGQPDLSKNLANNPGVAGGNVFGSPSTISGGRGRIALSDSRNRRVLLWNSPPVSPTELPALALGQPDFVSSLPYHGGPVSGDGFEMPGSVWSDGERLIVTDNHRVLIWNSWPTSNLQPADFVLGQATMTTNVANRSALSASSLWQASGVTVFEGRIYVSEAYNHRVLIFNQFPTQNGAPADLVLGQPDMTSNSSGAGSMPCIASSGASAANQIRCPQGVAKNATHLAVSAFGDSRVMVWNRPIVMNNQPADLVLGQNDLTQGILPSLPAPNTVSRPVGLSFTGDRLYVADFGWNRVLYWNTLPAQWNPPADGVIGQPDLRSGLPNSGVISGQTLSGPSSAFGSPDRLYIVDARNYRLLVMGHP
jgi:hypothetical protein